VSLVVISPEGEFTHYLEPVTSDGVQAFLPGGYFDLVRLPRHPDLYAAVDADGHPLGLPRNPVGSCLLLALGASAYAYCGPVIITGWHEPDDTSEWRDLTDLQLATLAAMFSGIKATLAGEPPAWMRVDADGLRDYAAWVDSAPPPGLHVRAL
jgi:hypothetical protein